MLIARVVHSYMYTRCIQATQIISQIEVYHVIATAMAIYSKCQKLMLIGVVWGVVATPPTCRDR